jgi:hypothetical protein
MNISSYFYVIGATIQFKKSVANLLAPSTSSQHFLKSVVFGSLLHSLNTLSKVLNNPGHMSKKIYFTVLKKSTFSTFFFL